MKRERVVVGSADRVNGEARATSKNLATDETQIEHGYEKKNTRNEYSQLQAAACVKFLRAGA